ncbi:MAG: lipid-transfer protein [Acidobacteria bacterium]|nr:lipid-transfer protein [Acidobacteriota bacterium]
MVDRTSLRDKAAIVGIGETDFSRDSGRSEVQLAVEAIKSALDDAGLKPEDVDGMVHIDMDNTNEVDVINCLGIKNLNSFCTVGYGGGGACGSVLHAAMMVATRLCNYVVGWRSLNDRSGRRFGQSQIAATVEGWLSYYAPYGLLTPGQWVAMSARRHMIEYGTTREHFASVALSCRQNANRNPRAVFYERSLSLEDYMSARMIAEPLCLYDYCLETDGACAWVMTSADRALDLKQRPAYILAAAQGTGSPTWVMTQYNRPTLTTGYESVQTANLLWEMAGVGPQDVDVTQIYDHFTPWVIVALEDFGFCKKGEGGPFASEGNIELGGKLPINTSGGLLSEGYIHGWNLINEGVRQIRGTSTAQVEGAELSLVTSGNGLPTSAILLRR